MSKLKFKPKKSDDPVVFSSSKGGGDLTKITPVQHRQIVFEAYKAKNKYVLDAYEEKPTLEEIKEEMKAEFEAENPLPQNATTSTSATAPKPSSAPTTKESDSKAVQKN